MKPISTQVILPPLRANVTLPELAQQCNEMITKRDDMRLEIAVRLAIAKKLIAAGYAKEHTYIAWAMRHIKRPNGGMYSSHYLYRMAKIGEARSPKAALLRDRAHYKEVYKAYSAKVTRAIQIVYGPSKTGRDKSGNVIRLSKAKITDSNVAEEVNKLITAWEQASSQARGQFLNLIDALPRSASGAA